jgi:GDP/UDP-N,N'-diacetylbacillosamine 2-epimerase (hydrolysing)
LRILQLVNTDNLLMEALNKKGKTGSAGNKKIVAFFTTSRAEFGILLPLIREVERSQYLDYKLFAGGSHLAAEYGETINEIRSSGLEISCVFDYLLNITSPKILCTSLGIGLAQLSEIFDSFHFDWVCILGDRIELLTITINAMQFNKPVIHLSGGEFTEGAIDNQVRHMITKAAHIHFTYTDEYVMNITRMNEEPWRIYNVGALGVDNLRNYPDIDKADLFSQLNLTENLTTALLTFHPSVLEDSLPFREQLNAIFDALAGFDIQLVITSPNAETGRHEIVNLIKERVRGKQGYYFYDSLGEKLYNNLLSYCDFIIGNSSSGITYAPFFKIPSVNIGERQKGRARHKSIIDCGYDSDDIKSAIKRSLSNDFRNEIKRMSYKFGGGESAKKIVEIISQTPINETLMIKKSPK